MSMATSSQNNEDSKMEYVEVTTNEIDLAEDTCDDVIDLTEEKQHNVVDIMEEKESVYQCPCLAEYMGVSIEQWIEEVNSHVSFKIKKIGGYSKSVYSTAIDSVMTYLSRDEHSFRSDISTFMGKRLNPDGYLNILHSKLTINYIAYKNHCLKYGIRNKAATSIRDDWYTTNIEFIDDDIQNQYLEIIHAILTNVSNVMMCSCMQQMNIN